MSVEPFPGEKSWDAKGVAGDTLERVDGDSRLVCLWLDADRRLRYSKTDLSLADYALLSLQLHQMAIDVMRENDE